jgi:hypothetical protein
MEDFKVCKNHRSERNLRIKSNLELDKWLRRRYARDNETCRRMAASLQEPDHTQTSFFKTFCPDEYMKIMVELGENPYRNPKMRPHMHKKKINKFKARARDRKSKMTAREFSFETTVPLDTEVASNLSGDRVMAWDNHIAFLKCESGQRAMMEIALKALIAQKHSLALQRGTKRKWSSVV